MNKLYNRIYWHNNTVPAINEDNLNAMSQAIDEIDSRVVDMAGAVSEDIPELEEALQEAQELIASLEELNERPPYIGANGDWYIWNTTTNQYVDSGVDASITVQIADITMLNYGVTPTVSNTGTATDPVFHLGIPRAATISSVTKTATVGNVDTYTMTLQDGSQFTFQVENGTAELGMVSDAQYAAIQTMLQ